MKDNIARMLWHLDTAQDEAFWRDDVEAFMNLAKTISEVEKAGSYDGRN